MKKSSMFYIAPALSLGTLLLGMPVTAGADWTEKVTVRGFLSAVYQQTDQDTAFYEGERLEGGIGSDGTMQGTQFGLNINAQMSDRLSIASQLHATRAEDSYTVALDWAFVSLNLSDNLDLRAGKLKFPGGLVGEYVDVGHLYPWIRPPREMYAEDLGASQATHESYAGVSLLASHNAGDMTYTADIFGGELAEENVLRTGFVGITLAANWDDKVVFRATTNTSTMATDGAMLAMNGRDHEIVQLGLKVDWNNVVVYSEWADVDMGDFKFGEAETSYLTFGYRIGNIMPHITYSQLEKAQKTSGGMIMMGRPVLPYEQATTTLGLRWDFMQDIALKVEVSQIELDSLDETTAGVGLFGDMPDDDSVTRYGIALDAVF